MDRFEQKEMKKKRPIKNTWDDWLISDIPNPMKKLEAVLKIKLQVLLRQKHQ